MTMAKSSAGAPRSIWTHWGPLRRKMMLWSEGSLSPSVSLERTVSEALVSLLVSFLPGAMFLRPAGTIIGGRGLSESGSTKALSWMSLGVPLKAGSGSFRVRGTRSSARRHWVSQKLAPTRTAAIGNQRDRRWTEFVFIFRSFIRRHYGVFNQTGFKGQARNRLRFSRLSSAWTFRRLHRRRGLGIVGNLFAFSNPSTAFQPVVALSRCEVIQPEGTKLDPGKRGIGPSFVHRIK